MKLFGEFQENEVFNIQISYNRLGHIVQRFRIIGNSFISWAVLGPLYGMVSKNVSYLYLEFCFQIFLPNEVSHSVVYSCFLAIAYPVKLRFEDIEVVEDGVSEVVVRVDSLVHGVQELVGVVVEY